MVEVTPVVEVLGLLIAALYLYSARRGPWREYVVVALAGWLAEESSMLLYGYYGYGDAWALSLHRTPLAVALLWPLVVLTSLSLVRLAPVQSRLGAALCTGGLVVWDTLVLEPVATRAGLWWWKDGGYFGVPVLGVLGWGLFAIAAVFVLWRSAPIRGAGFVVRAAAIAALTQALLAPLAFPAIAEGWTIPVSEEAYAWIVGSAAVVAVPLAYRLRERVCVELKDIAFKVAGAAIFFGLIYGLWLEPFVGFCSLVPLPYWVVMRLRPSQAVSPRVRHVS